MSTELTKLNLPGLLASAKQLNVVIEIDRAELEQELVPLLDGQASLELAAKTLAVTDEETNQRAADLMEDCYRRQKGLQEIIDRYKAPLNKARGVILDLEKKTAVTMENLKKVFAEKSRVYLKAQERAKKQVEAQLATVVKKNQQQLLAEAEELLLEGRVTEAQGKMAEAAMTVAPELPDLVQKAEGQKITPKHTWVKADLMAFIQAVASGKVPLMQEVKPGDFRPVIDIDPVVVNAVVSRQGMGLRWPGITVEEDIAVGVGRRG